MNTHLILIDFRDYTTAYMEIENLREANMRFENLKDDGDIEYMRIRYSDGTQSLWENPDDQDDFD